MANVNTSSDGPQLTPLGRAFVFLFIIGCMAGATYLFLHNRTSSGTKSAVASLFSFRPAVEIGVAYGTEKRGWLEWAVGEFARTPEGKRIKVNLIPMGSLESAQALLNGDQRITVWAPASAAYRDIFVGNWQRKYNDNPIVREEPLALTPMVFVIWDDRYKAFLEKYQHLSLDTVSQAVDAKDGWNEIAHHPDWGNFKFGQTRPSESNSGLMAMALSAYAYHHKAKNLTVKDVQDPGFQKWLAEFEGNVTGLSNSAGNLMQEMILRGPSSYDGMFVYENLAIESLAKAEGRWGKLRVVYPEYNVWNDNPYYIINASWSSADQRKAADAFLNFLLTEPVQKESLKHGFRPANPNIPVKAPDSPFVQYAGDGVSIDLPKICEPVKTDVVSSLLASWQSAQGNR